MRDKRETETHPGVGVVKEEKVPNSRKPSHRQFCGEFWNLRGQHNWEEKKKKTQNTCPTATANREVAQMLVSAISKQGLDRRHGLHCLGYRQGLDALRTIRELM